MMAAQVRAHRCGAAAGTVWRLLALVTVLGTLAGCAGMRKGSPADAGTGLDLDAASSLAVGPVEAGAASATGAPDGVAPEVLPHGPARDARVVGAHCPGSEIAIVLAPGEEGCVIECRSNAGCPAGWTCDGEGALSAGGKPGSAVRYCRIAGHAQAHDGGVAPAVSPIDAGKPPAAVADAGKPAPVPDAKKLDVKHVGGQCPAGYKTCGAVCRLTCGKNADCGLPTVHCQAGFCLGPGALPCAK